MPHNWAPVYLLRLILPHPLSFLGALSTLTFFGYFRGIIIIFVSGPLHMLFPLLGFQFYPLSAGQLPPIL